MPNEILCNCHTTGPRHALNCKITIMNRLQRQQRVPEEMRRKAEKREKLTLDAIYEAMEKATGLSFYRTQQDEAATHHRSCPYRQGIPNCTCGE